MSTTIGAPVVLGSGTTTSQTFTTATTFGHTPAVGNRVVIVIELNSTASITAHADWGTPDKTVSSAVVSAKTVWYSRTFDGTEQASYSFSWASTFNVVTAYELHNTTGSAWLGTDGVSDTGTASTGTSRVFGATPTLPAVECALIGAISTSAGQGGGSKTVTGGGTWTVTTPTGTTDFWTASLLSTATTAVTATWGWPQTAAVKCGGIYTYYVIPPVESDLDLRWQQSGAVSSDLDLRWKLGGPLSSDLDFRWMLDGPLPAGWSVKTQVAWTTDPLTRPAEIDWTTLTEGIRSLTIKRGTRILSTGLETGTATVVLDNSTNRDLDPNYTGSAYFPNVIPRRRIRFVLCDAAGNTLKVLHTGFIEKYGLGWSLDTAQVTIPTQDLFGLIAGATLPSSVLDVVTRGQDPSAPVTTPTAYWPMHETVFTGTADDVIGTLDGTYVGPVTSGSQLTRFDPRPSPQFAKPGTVNGDQIDCTAMVVTGLSLPDSFSFSCWFKWNVGGYDNVNPAVLILQAGSPPSTDPAYPTPSPNQILMYLSQDAISGRHHINIRVQNGTSIAIVKVPIGVLLLDGDPHHLAFSVLGASKEIRTWCDGFGGTVATDTGIGGTVALSTLNVSSIITSLNTLGVGWGIDWNNVSGTVADSAIVGETAYWASHVLTDPEVDFIVDAGNNAWDGDTTDERADRLFDLIGVDPGDRNFAVGTQTCGPTILGNQNALAYFKKIVATEQGAGFVDGDGRATLTARPTSPPIIQTFSDDPVGDSGAAAEPIRPENDWSRIVNTVTVGRENDADQTIQDTTSAGTYGPLSGSVGGKIDTLHQTADDARATGQFVVDGHKNPTSYIPDVKVSSVEGTVALSTLTDVEVADLVAVIGRPPSPLNEPIVVHAQVEHVQYDFPNPTEMTTTYSPGDGVQILTLDISDGGTTAASQPTDISDGGTTAASQPTDISDGTTTAASTP